MGWGRPVHHGWKPWPMTNSYPARRVGRFQPRASPWVMDAERRTALKGRNTRTAAPSCGALTGLTHDGPPDPGRCPGLEYLSPSGSALKPPRLGAMPSRRLRGHALKVMVGAMPSRRLRGHALKVSKSMAIPPGRPWHPSVAQVFPNLCAVLIRHCTGCKPVPPRAHPRGRGVCGHVPHSPKTKAPDPFVHQSTGPLPCTCNTFTHLAAWTVSRPLARDRKALCVNDLRQSSGFAPPGMAGRRPGLFLLSLAFGSGYRYNFPLAGSHVPDVPIWLPTRALCHFVYLRSTSDHCAGNRKENLRCADS